MLQKRKSKTDKNQSAYCYIARRLMNQQDDLNGKGILRVPLTPTKSINDNLIPKKMRPLPKKTV